MKREGIRVQAARAWAERHSYYKHDGRPDVHAAFEDEGFKKLWDSFQKSPTDYKRRRLGLPEYRKAGEKAEQRQLTTLRLFRRYAIRSKYVSLRRYKTKRV